MTVRFPKERTQTEAVFTHMDEQISIIYNYVNT